MTDQDIDECAQGIYICFSLSDRDNVKSLSLSCSQYTRKWQKGSD